MFSNIRRFNMFCEKCGSNNPVGAVVCSKCGEKMPATEGGNGFKDILSMDVPVAASQPASTNSADYKTVQKLEHKINRVVQAEKKLVILSLISIIVSAILIIALIFVSSSSNENYDMIIDGYKKLENKYDKLAEQVDSVEQKFKEYNGEEVQPSNEIIDKTTKWLENFGTELAEVLYPGGLN